MPSILDEPQTISIPYPLRAYGRARTEIIAIIGTAYSSDQEAFILPKRYGLSVRERKMAAAAIKSQAHIQKDLAELVMTVANESGASISEIAAAIDNKQQQLVFFANHMETLQSIMLRNAMVDDDVSMVTTLIKSRINPDFTIEHALDMTESLFDVFLQYIAGERAGWPNEEESQPDPKDLLEESSEPQKAKSESPNGKGSGSKLVKDSKASKRS